MDITTTIRAVCEMAKQFEERGNVSEIALLRESGYLENPDQITEADILEYLRHYPDLINTWLLQSQNKRTTHSWYMKSPDDNDSQSNVWIVGFYPGDEIHEFRDEASACAFYVKQEAEQIRHIMEKTR
jgi:hypothetical protein